MLGFGNISKQPPYLSLPSLELLKRRYHLNTDVAD